MNQDQNCESDTALTAVSNGRPIKFTPERLEQIKNLVERGKSSQEIAELIGATVGSLKVTCSRVGISLRRPKPNQATPVNRQPPVTPASRQPQPPVVPVNGEKCCFVRLSHGHRAIELRLSQDLIGHLAIEAHFKNLTLSELISKLLTSALGNNGAA